MRGKHSIRQPHISGGVDQRALFDEASGTDNPGTESLSLADEWLEAGWLTDFATDTRLQKASRESIANQDNLRLVQRQFNELHEEIYRKGGIRPTNAAIDEVGKLIFLKVHTEKYPDYVLTDGSGCGKRFLDIFNSDYIRKNGNKAARELQDAFREISVLPCYLSHLNGETQSIFPYQEPLRLEHPDVLAMAVKILSPLSLSIPDNFLLENVQKQWESFSHQDLLGSAYDVFLRGKYDSAGGLGTYLTPDQVVDCMVRMAFSHISDEQLWAGKENLPVFRVGDICCGTGRFLVRALAEVRTRILNTSGKSRQEKLDWLTLMKRHAFLGADQSASSIIKARINFLLFGEPHAQLYTVEDSILDERIDHLAGKFDLILTNPPFGEGKYTTQSGLEKLRRQDLDLQLGWSWKTNEQKKKPLSRADPALLFIDRNLQLLKPGGLLLIVLPDGILEPAYAYAHRYLLKKAALKAVVSLPRDTFAMAGTVAKTSFLCLQKREETKSDGKETVFMAVADHVGYLKKGTVEVPDPEGNDLPFIADVYEDFQKQSLQTQRELSREPMIVAVPAEKLQDSLTSHTYHSDRLRAGQLIAALSKEVCRLQDVVTLVKSQQANRTEKTAYFISILHVDERSNVDWQTAATYMPASKGLRCSPGDILFSCLNPSKMRVTVIPDGIQGEVLCSMEFAILRPRQGEDPYFIALALRTTTSQRQILPLAKGTSSSRRRVREQDLTGILLPYPQLSLRKQISEQFRTALESARNALSDNCASLLTLERYIQNNQQR
ncbi:MAG: N-6 DNA methylase [Ktedonobacteraceae bacterium]|nr:N-6 DNA methylase [Ktedonobacteraceae bacterium]